MELLELVTRNTEEHDADLGAYICRTDELAFRTAERCDAAFAKGIDTGPLQGIPIGVKDNIDVLGVPTTAQSESRRFRSPAERDGHAVARLKSAGAVITGKLTLQELAIGLPDEGMTYPLPRNPWDSTRWAGGSSSGTAIGIASGMILGGVGTDTGGSIRMPAAYCGVSGFKPTFGAVPTGGSVPLSYSLDHVGPMARTALDCAELFRAMRSEDMSNGGRRTDPPRDQVTSLNMRLGVVRQPSPTGPSAATDSDFRFDAAVRVFRDLGYDVLERTLPLFDEATTAAFVTVVCESLATHRDALRRSPGLFGPGFRHIVTSGALWSGVDYVQAQRVRRAAQNELRQLFSDVDFIAMPVASRVAPKFDEFASSSIDAMAGVFTTYWNAVGNPALAVPMGLGKSGLPLGLQIAGRPGDDEAVLEIGQAFQANTTWHEMSPSLGSGYPNP